MLINNYNGYLCKIKILMIFNVLTLALLLYNENRKKIIFFNTIKNTFKKYNFYKNFEDKFLMIFFLSYKTQQKFIH